MPDIITSANVKTLMQAADFAAFRTSLGLGALSTVTPGTGVATALAVNIGSAGAPILFNGAGGTPSSMVGTNITGTAAGLTAGAVAVGGITGLGTGVGTFLATPSSANLAAAVTGETGTGALVFGTSPIILNPANALGGTAIDVTKQYNTKSVNADTTFTFSATPTAGGDFGLVLTETGGTARTITIPSSYDEGSQSAITTFTLPANGVLTVGWHYDGTGYTIFGVPQTSSSAAFNPSQKMELYSDFLNGTNQFWQTSTSAFYNIATADATNPGTCVINANNTHGTTAMEVDGMTFGGGEVVFETRLYLTRLSSSGDFVLRVGFGDTIDGTAFTDGVWFEYTDNVNSGNFVAKAKAGGTSGSTNLASGPVLNTWVTLKIIVNAGATSATFYINGTSAGSVSTANSIPNSASEAVGMMISCNSTSANLTQTFVDYAYLSQTFSTPR